MQILWINIIMDGPPAQSLGVEPPDESVTKSRKPRNAKESIINREVFSRVLLSAACIVFGTSYVFYKEIEWDKDNNAITTPRDTTMTFTAFVFFDMLNAWSCRSQYQSITKIKFFSNKPFLWAVSVSILAQFLVIYVPFFQKIFVTEALSGSDLWYLLTVASSIIMVTEAWKYRKRSSSKKFKMRSRNYLGKGDCENLV